MASTALGQSRMAAAHLFRRGGTSRNGNLMQRDPIPAGYISPGDTPFLKKLPREIRDKIYEELLIVRRTSEDEEKYDKLQEALQPGHHEYEIEREFDFMAQDYALVPDYTDPNKGSLYIGKNKVILLANKQIYEEATTVLFGQNLFGVALQWKEVCAFWRTNARCGCMPKNRPCLVRPETACKIRHLAIFVHKPDDSEATIANLERNLNIMVDTFLSIEIKLLSLKIRYWSEFGGETEAVREDVEGIPRPGMPERTVQIKHATTGRFHYIRQSKANEKLFQNIRILEPLKKLKGVGEYVDVRGDLPSSYRDELINTLSAPDPGPAAVAKKKAKAEAASKKTKSPGLADFAASLLEKNPDADERTKAWYRQMINTPTRSPAVNSLLFPEIYDGSLHRDSRSRPQQQARSGPIGAGIGTIAGKPVFGPPRPPSME